MADFSSLASILADERKRDEENSPWMLTGKGLIASASKLPQNNHSNNPWASAIASALMGVSGGLVSGYGKGQVDADADELGKAAASALTSEDPQTAFNSDPRLQSMSGQLAAILGGEKRNEDRYTSQLNQQLEKQKQYANYEQGLKLDPANINYEAQRAAAIAQAQLPFSLQEIAARHDPNFGVKVDPSAQHQEDELAGRISDGTATLEDRMDARINELKASGLKPAQAATQARQEYAPEIKSRETALKDINALYDRARTVTNLATQAEGALNADINTGLGSGLSKLYADNMGEPNKAAAYGVLSSLTPQVIGSLRQNIPGPISDRESGWLLQGGPSLDKSEAANRAIIAQMKQDAVYTRGLADFLANYVKANGSYAGGREAYEQLLLDNQLGASGNGDSGALGDVGTKAAKMRAILGGR